MFPTLSINMSPPSALQQFDGAASDLVDGIASHLLAFAKHQANAQLAQSLTATVDYHFMHHGPEHDGHDSHGPEHHETPPAVPDTTSDVSSDVSSEDSVEEKNSNIKAKVTALLVDSRSVSSNNIPDCHSDEIYAFARQKEELAPFLFSLLNNGGATKDNLERALSFIGLDTDGLAGLMGTAGIGQVFGKGNGRGGRVPEDLNANSGVLGNAVGELANTVGELANTAGIGGLANTAATKEQTVGTNNLGKLGKELPDDKDNKNRIINDVMSVFKEKNAETIADRMISMFTKEKSAGLHFRPPPVRMVPSDDDDKTRDRSGKKSNPEAWVGGGSGMGFQVHCPAFPKNPKNHEDQPEEFGGGEENHEHDSGHDPADQGMTILSAGGGGGGGVDRPEMYIKHGGNWTAGGGGGGGMQLWMPV